MLVRQQQQQQHERLNALHRSEVKVIIQYVHYTTAAAPGGRPATMQVGSSSTSRKAQRMEEREFALC